LRGLATVIYTLASARLHNITLVRCTVVVRLKFNLYAVKSQFSSALERNETDERHVGGTIIFMLLWKNFILTIFIASDLNTKLDK
jgi:hypothetical protein